MGPDWQLLLECERGARASQPPPGEKINERTTISGSLEGSIHHGAPAWSSLIVVVVPGQEPFIGGHQSRLTQSVSGYHGVSFLSLSLLFLSALSSCGSIR